MSQRDGANPIAWVLFGLLLAQTVLLGAAWLSVDPQIGQAEKHPRHQDMLKANSQAELKGAPVMLAALLGIVQIAAIGALLMLGARRTHKGVVAAISLGTLLLAGVFVSMTAAYLRSLEQSPVGFLGPFPTATSIMIGGLWLTPLLFVALYVIAFNRLVISEENVERFHAKVKLAHAAQAAKEEQA